MNKPEENQEVYLDAWADFMAKVNEIDAEIRLIDSNDQIKTKSDWCKLMHRVGNQFGRLFTSFTNA